MTDDTTLPFSFPAVRGKKLTAAFDGGRLSSDGGVMLLAEAARRMGIAEKLAAVIPDRRDPTRVTHPLAEILRARILAIACGYEDADDLDGLRTDPAFKLACGRLPESGTDLMSQPTVSRWENAPTLRDLVRLGGVMVDLYCASYATPPTAIMLDIDDTVDVVHGHQQLSLFNAHYDERCFLPIHVYDTATGRPVAMILRPGKTPSGIEVRGHLRRLVRRIRRHWPTTRITIRGDGHYGRPEVMDWCEANGVDYVFGLHRHEGPRRQGRGGRRRHPRRARDRGQGRRARLRRDHPCRQVLDAAAPRRRPHRGDAARSRHPLRRHQHRDRHGRMALCRPLLRPRPGREPDQAAQGPARLRPHQLPRRRSPTRCGSSCTPPPTGWSSPCATPSPRPHALAKAEFTTIRLRLLKVAARVTETASRVRIAFAAPARTPSSSATWPTRSAADRHSHRARCPLRPHLATFNA